MAAVIEITYDANHVQSFTVTVKGVGGAAVWDGSGPTVESALFAALQVTADSALELALDEFDGAPNTCKCRHGRDVHMDDGEGRLVCMYPDKACSCINFVVWSER